MGKVVDISYDLSEKKFYTLKKYQFFPNLNFYSRTNKLFKIIIYKNLIFQKKWYLSSSGKTWSKLIWQCCQYLGKSKISIKTPGKKMKTRFDFILRFKIKFPIKNLYFEILQNLLRFINKFN